MRPRALGDSSATDARRRDPVANAVVDGPIGEKCARNVTEARD